MSDAALLDGLRQRARDEIRRVTPAGPVALLDFPNYANPGDSAIWLGALACLASLGFAPPVYVSESRTFDERLLRRAMPIGTILLMGGGSLGDLWPEAQVFRERVVRAFPDHAIVQLPQTAHFSSRTTIARARETFAAHPNLTILVRDARSLEVVTNDLGVRASLCPDLAFCLTPDLEPAIRQASVPNERFETLRLLHTDHESSGSTLPGEVSVDWGTDLRQPGVELVRAVGDYLVSARSPEDPSVLERAAQRVLSASYSRLARSRLRRGCRVLRSARVIVTDRLHGHVIALLLGVPHVVLGDRNRKLRGFVDAWTSTGSSMRWANNAAEVHALTRELLDRA